MRKYSQTENNEYESMDPEEIGTLGTVLMLVFGGVAAYFFFSGIYYMCVNLIK